MVNFLIVYAHEEETSLNAAIKNATVKTLQKAGHTVVVSDLYKQKFQPILGKKDIKGSSGPLTIASWSQAMSDFFLYSYGNIVPKGNIGNPENFNYGRETLAAMREDRLSDDILEEHKKLSDAEIIIFQFPMYWSGFPAILKGWFDRIFTQGFAFGPDMMFDKAFFKGKKALLSFTTGGPRGWYTHSGPMGDIEVTLWPLQNGVLRFSGFDVLSPHIMFGMDFAQWEECSKLIEEWMERLKTLTSEKTLTFLSISDYDPINPEDTMTGFTVRQSLIDSMPADRGLTYGQHLGRPLPTGTMYIPAANEDCTGQKIENQTGKNAIQ